MQTFNLFCGSHLGYKLYSISHNLSKTLQAENMSGIESQKHSQKVASLMVKTLEGMRKTFDSGLEAYDYCALRTAKNSKDQITNRSKHIFKLMVCLMTQKRIIRHLLSRISTETFSCENVLENDFQSRFSLVECFFLSEKAQKVEIFSTHWRREMFSPRNVK